MGREELLLDVTPDVHTKSSRPHFTKPNGDLLYHGQYVPEQLRRNATRTHEGHIVPEITERYALQALVYCIAAQYTGFSRHAEALRRVTSAPLEQLHDADYLDAQVRGVKSIQSKKKDNRFAPIMQFIDSWRGGLTGLIDTFIDDPVTVRRCFADEVDYMSCKTTSLWYLCLGGPELMTLDRHNMRQLAGIGIDVPSRYTVGRSRILKKYGRRNVTDSIRTVDEYEDFESQAIERLSDIPWLHVDGYFSPARATCLFWYTGLLHGSEGGPYRRDANLVPVPVYSNGDTELPPVVARAKNENPQTALLALDI